MNKTIIEKVIENTLIIKIDDEYLKKQLKELQNLISDRMKIHLDIDSRKNKDIKNIEKHDAIKHFIELGQLFQCEVKMDAEIEGRREEINEIIDNLYDTEKNNDKYYCIADSNSIIVCASTKNEKFMESK